MPRNVEIKAHVPDMEALTSRVSAIADSGPNIVQQDDTFFVCSNGRLKLRELVNNNGELIFYRRPDETGPKESDYTIALTTEPAQLRKTLFQAYGVCGRVRKKRTVYMIGQTRIHLDSVDGLGNFLEFEVVLSESETTEHGVAIANDLLDRLGVSRDDLVEGAYVDLIERHKRKI